MADRKEAEINFRKALEQAGKLEETAEALQHVYKETFENAMQTVAENWKGESASLYLKKGTGLQEDIREMVSELRTIAEDIRRTARRVLDEEMKGGA